MEEIKKSSLESESQVSSVAVNLSSSNLNDSISKKKIRKISLVKISEIFSKFKQLPPGKKTLFLAVLIVVFLLISAGIAFAFIQLSATKRLFTSEGWIISEDGNSYDESLNEPKPEDIKDQESPLNGVLYTTTEMEEMASHYPLAIVVENHFDARPQSGLGDADIVYEFLAEGGITRFLAIFWGNQSDQVGPVRSARKYMIDILSEYDALFMHIGWAESTGNTNTDAAAYISSTNTKSFLWGGYYWRSSDRVAPHNAYTETSKLWDQAVTKGWTVDDYSTSSWIFKNDKELEDRPLTSTINVSFGSSGDTYDVTWLYNRDSNSYFRNCAGEESIDKNTGLQLEFKDVVVQEVDKSYPSPKDDKARIILDVIGEGNVTIFRDGEAIEGTWKKESRTSKTRFYDSDGIEIELNRGKIWIQMIPVYNGKLEGSLTYN